MDRWMIMLSCNCSHLCPLRGAVIFSFQKTSICKDGDKTATRQSQSATSLQSMCGWMSSCWYLTCSLLLFAANLSFKNTEIHINYLQSESSQNLINLKQNFRNSSTNIDVVAAGFNCEMSSMMYNISADWPTLIATCWQSVYFLKLHKNHLQTFTNQQA